MNTKAYWERVHLQAALSDRPQSPYSGTELARYFELGDVLKHGPLFAITLHQPWAWCIFALGKDIENRAWAYPSDLNGAWVAIHAGLSYDALGAEWLRRSGRDIPPKSRLAMGAIVGLVRLGGCVEDSKSIWFAGWPSKGWILEEPYRLQQAIKCRGHKKFWTVETQVRQMIYEEWQEREGA
jgi:hypothetical protein